MTDGNKSTGHNNAKHVIADFAIDAIVAVAMVLSGTDLNRVIEDAIVITNLSTGHAYLLLSLAKLTG